MFVLRNVTFSNKVKTFKNNMLRSEERQFFFFALITQQQQQQQQHAPKNVFAYVEPQVLHVALERGCSCMHACMVMMARTYVRISAIIDHCSICYEFVHACESAFAMYTYTCVCACTQYYTVLKAYRAYYTTYM